MQKTYGFVLAYEAASDTCWERIPQETAYEVYRITQELMTNIAKHAGAHSVSVSLSAVTDEKYRLRIENDGNAFSAAMAADATNKQGGIRTIQDRAKSISAVFETLNESGRTVFLLTF